ncbi:MAG: hypothetical protein V4536_08210 [Pseudomonadota bacterium]
MSVFFGIGSRDAGMISLMQAQGLVLSGGADMVMDEPSWCTTLNYIWIKLYSLC